MEKAVFDLINKKIIIVLITSILFSLSASAGGFAFDANTFYFTNTLTTTTDLEESSTVFSLFFGFPVNNKARFLLGWNYGSYSSESVNGTTTTEYSSAQMGPMFVYFIDKSKSWRIAFAYNLVTTGEYTTTGSTTKDLRGTGLAGDIGYQIEFSETVFMGLRLNYSSTSFNESKVGTTAEDVSYEKSMIYPSVAFSFLFL